MAAIRNITSSSMVQDKCLYHLSKYWYGEYDYN